MSDSGIEIAVRLAKGQSALARLLGCTPQCVQKWVKQGFAAPKQCKKIAEAFKGHVTLAQLNPSIYGDIALA